MNPLFHCYCWSGKEIFPDVNIIHLTLFSFPTEQCLLLQDRSQVRKTRSQDPFSFLRHQKFMSILYFDEKRRPGCLFFAFLIFTNWLKFWTIYRCVAINVKKIKLLLLLDKKFSGHFNFQATGGWSVPFIGRFVWILSGDRAAMELKLVYLNMFTALIFPNPPFCYRLAGFKPLEGIIEAPALTRSGSMTEKILFWPKSAPM